MCSSDELNKGIIQALLHLLDLVLKVAMTVLLIAPRPGRQPRHPEFVFKTYGGGTSPAYDRHREEKLCASVC